MMSILGKVKKYLIRRNLYLLYQKYNIFKFFIVSLSFEKVTLICIGPWRTLFFVLYLTRLSV